MKKKPSDTTTDNGRGNKRLLRGLTPKTLTYYKKNDNCGISQRVYACLNIFSAVSEKSVL